MSVALSEKFSALKERKLKGGVQGDDSDNKALQQLALETAVLADQEVSRLKNSIAELEALLNSNNSRNPEVVGPGLHTVGPSIVPIDDHSRNGEDDVVRKSNNEIPSVVNVSLSSDATKL